MLIPANENMQNMLPNFFCEKCDYLCYKKSSWNQHLLTAKHKNANFSAFLANNANKKYACEKCDKSFKHKSSYCRHKKSCICDDKNVQSDSESETNDKISEK